MERVGQLADKVPASTPPRCCLQHKRGPRVAPGRLWWF